MYNLCFILLGQKSIVAYQKSNEKTEKLCVLFCIAVMTTGFIGILQSLIQSIINYYVLNLGEQSFSLALPAELVSFTKKIETPKQIKTN